MFLQHKQPSPSQICFYKRWSIQMKTSLFKDSFPWGRGEAQTGISGAEAQSIELAPLLRDPSLLPSPSRWHWCLIEQKFHLYCYGYENKNLNIFLITFPLGRERLFIMQRSVVTLSNKGVRWESNTQFWRLERSQQCQRRGESGHTLTEGWNTFRPQRGAGGFPQHTQRPIVSPRLHLNLRYSIKSSHDC